jgi:hypothetical protein
MLPFIKKAKRVKNIFYGLEDMFRRYKYLVFSDSIERRMINGKYLDKISEYLVKVLGKDNVLIIETPADGLHYRRSQISSKHIISSDVFRFLHYFFFPSIKRVSINNAEIISELNKKYELNVNYRSIIFSFFSLEKLFKLFYKVWLPEAIFINCSYSTVHHAALYAAKNMGIKTIELQHGIINKKHFAYNVFTKLDNNFYPDYLFVFGDYVKDVFSNYNYFISKENVFSVGNMYLDYIRNEYNPDDSTVKLFSEFRIKYKKIVAVSSQITVEKKLINFLNKSANLSKEILYIFVPRDLNKDYSSVSFADNIILLKDKRLDVYKIIKESDFHSTVSSTCALEAPALGIPNVLINIDNLAKYYYSDLLIDSDITRFVDTPEEYVKVLISWHPIGKEEIIYRHRLFYKQNHKESLMQALRTIGIKRNVA